ncbi:MAG: universal stress protein [Bacteroidales bacterium]|nr:universal stress protein [Bacteroidales bacterium]
MEKEKEIILVPFDFKINSENSLLHAVQLATKANNGILIAHIIHKGLFSKPLSDDEKDEVIKKLKKIAEEIENKYKIKPEVTIKEGNFVKSIKDLLLESNINLVIMGQFYEIGKTKIDAPDIVNFFRNSRIKKNAPVIITQLAPQHNHYVEIVVPINYQKEFKETLRWVMHLSKYYKCNINFIKPFYTDPEKKRLMANNMYFTKKMLDNNNIVYGIKTAKKFKNYGEEILRFASDIDADLIVVMADKYRELLHENKAKDGHETNTIPIMCIKPMPKKFQGFY